MWNFEHEPVATDLRERYNVHYTLPSQCAAQLASGEADLGLIPIAALPALPQVRAVPGCTIASLREVRSIQLVLRPGVSLNNIRTLAADTASRSSTMYVRLLLRHFYNHEPMIYEQAADLRTMLQAHDAALLIGDPALLALEQREATGSYADCTWVDVAALWRQHTGLPWVAAVWAVNPAALTRCSVPPEVLIDDLAESRDAGLAHVEQLIIEWRGRVPLPDDVIRTYLTGNIHYQLDRECLLAVDRFYSLASSASLLPPYHLQLL